MTEPEQSSSNDTITLPVWSRRSDFQALKDKAIIDSVHELGIEGMDAIKAKIAPRPDPKPSVLATIGLLQDPTLTFAVISDRMGVSKQRIAQIHKSARGQGIEFPRDKLSREEWEAQAKEAVTNEQEPVFEGV